MAAILTIVLALVFRDRRRGALVASSIVIGLLLYGHVHHIATSLHVPTFVQQAGWVALVVIAIVGAIRLDERRITALDTALGRIAAILVIVTLVLIVPYQVRVLTERPSGVRVEPAAATTTAQKRDVYWLVFDRYGSDRSLSLRYGVENDLTPWLTEQGFTVLPDSHANYVRTALSMSTTLNMAPLTDIANRMGADSPDLTPVNDWLQAPLVARQFKALGYRYDHIGSWWAPTHHDSLADSNFVGVADEFAAALYDESAVGPLLRRLHLPALVDDARMRQYKTALAGLDALDGLVDDPGPKFVQAHILLPHPPLVFDEDGSFLSNEDESALSANEQYERQLAYTNTRLKAFLERIVALPRDQQPIVILQADEGPWSRAYAANRKTTFDWATATPDDLEVKFGIMNAWYLPGGEDLGLSPTQTAVNTFRVLFSRYFGIEYPLLPDSVYTSATWGRPYDLTDITGRLPSLR